jgi:hypothetical protein
MIMDKYIVRLIFSVKSNTLELDQIDEQWRLVNASCADEALETAMKIGRLESETIQRNDGHQITWNFLSVSGVINLSALSDGAMIFTHTPEVLSMEVYSTQINSRMLRHDAVIA